MQLFTGIALQTAKARTEVRLIGARQTTMKSGLLFEIILLNGV